MAKRRSPLSPRTPVVDVERRREPVRDPRGERSRAAPRGQENDTLPGPQLSRADQQALRQDTLIARAAAQRVEVELRAARADQHRSDCARAQAVVALDRLHARYAEALDRLRAADARILALEAQNALLRAQLGRDSIDG